MAPLSAFVGRDQDQDRLRAVTDERRLVTVTGPGGVGKTRLVQATLGDDAVLVELAPLVAGGDVAAEAAARLGHGSTDEWALTLADRAVTVVLDNCEHVRDAAAAMATALLAAGPGVRVLATSREPLDVEGEHLFVLDPLDDRAAVELFVDRAQASGAKVDPEDPALHELCERLDRLPLAVELAAARARTLTAAELLGHLDRRFDLLTGLEGVIAVSYELLAPEEQVAFRRLAVLPGRFALDVAHGLIGDGTEDSLPSLDRMADFVDRSLVVVESAGTTTRYRLLDSLRDYGLSQLEVTHETDDAGDALAAAMTAEADRTMGRAVAGWSADVLAAILDQFQCYLAALDWCLAHDEVPDRAHTLLAPLWGGVHHARHREVAMVGLAVLERWPDESVPDRAQVEAIVANARLLSGEVDQALAGAEDVLERPVVSPMGRIVAFRTLAIGRRHIGDLDGAAQALTAAHELAVKVRAGSFAREIAVYEAGVTAQSGDVDGALAALTELARETTEHDEPIAASWARVEAASLLIQQGRAAAARPLLDEARQTGLDVGYHWSVAAATRLLAVIEVAEEGWTAAGPAWRAALDAAAVAGDGDALAETVRAAAGAARAAGENTTADALWTMVPPEQPITTLPPLHPDESAGPRLSPIELLRRAETVLGGGAGPSAAPTPPPSATAGLVRDGDGWQVTYGGRTAHVSHRKGLDDLAQLLVRPGQEVHCLELMGGVDTGDAGPALDDQARRAYQQRVRDLQQEIDEAAEHNDPGRAERAELELDALVEELSASLGLGGKARSEKSAAERARSAVTWRIRASVRHLEGPAPEPARHLHNAIRTGTWCTYRPETAVDWTILR